MKQEQKEIIKTRIISSCFVLGALVVFKPFGFDTSQWITYVHLFAFFIPSVCVCLLTDIILKYMLKMPPSGKHGIDYIIRRNLCFQLINTPLMSLVICLYRHFVMNNYVVSNQFSLTNYLETLVIIAFCSFTVGLYWRFKLRSKFLAMELEETRMLNEQLKKIQLQESLVAPTSEVLEDTKKEVTASSALSADGHLVLKGTTSDSITLDISNLLYIEAVGNYVKVYRLVDDKVRTDMLRATSKQIEENLRSYPMVVRCHRAFLVNLGHVERVVSQSGSMQLVMRHCHDSLPVSRSNVAQIKETISGMK